MCPAGYLGNHAAVPGVNFILRVSDGRENPTFPVQHRSTRIVARSFNGKKNSTRFCVSSSYHDQRIFSGIPIVSRPTSAFAEPPALVQSPSGRIPHPNLQDTIRATSHSFQELIQERSGHARPPPTRGTPHNPLLDRWMLPLPWSSRPDCPTRPGTCSRSRED